MNDTHAEPSAARGRRIGRWQYERGVGWRLDGTDLVLSGHVHNYQRFTRTLHEGHVCTYVVSGNGGYHNLHKLAPGASPGQELSTAVVFEAGDDSNWGYLRLTVTGGKITGHYIAVPLSGPTVVADQFTVG